MCKMNPKIYEFDAVLQKVDGIDGAYIEFPWDVKEEFQKGRVCVHATFDNVAYDGSLVRMQTVRHILGVRKDIRAKIGKQPGDSIHVTIQEAAEEADSKAAFIRIHLPGHSVSAAVLWGYLRIQCAIARFPTPHIG